LVNVLTEDRCTCCGSRLWVICPACGLRNPRRRMRCIECEAGLHPKVTRRGKGENGRPWGMLWKQFGRVTLALLVLGLAATGIIIYLERT